MKLRMVGCHHRHGSVAVRERLAFNDNQTEAALVSWRDAYPNAEAVLLSTCNRVELYAAVEEQHLPPCSKSLAEHLAYFHQVPIDELRPTLVTLEDEDVVRHLFRVAASLDSMVVGEPQILAQVKKSYDLARGIGSTGPLTHQFFQAALRTARRVAGETPLHRHRVSIPSIAVADFASRIFERFDDKMVLVIGAGEMAEETLRYLVDAGTQNLQIANRNLSRAQILAEKWRGAPVAWDQLHEQLVEADLVISTTGANQPIVTLEAYRQHVAPRRHQRPLFILDLAVPRDFEPVIGEHPGTYLYSIDDLANTCEKNRQARQTALPAAEKIVSEETHQFLAEARHRLTVPVVAELQDGFRRIKQKELVRLFRKVPDLDDRDRQEIEQFADRLIAKLLHPPMESLRKVSHQGSPGQLVEALRKLFQLKE
jgi:glutamyl-tRNA reductase